METLDLSQAQDKATVFKDYILEARNSLGGVIVSLIIPEAFRDLIPYPVEGEPPNDDFYALGYYNRFSFITYVDKTLTDCVCLVCNMKTKKFKVNYA
jgi:hypothetical protein